MNGATIASSALVATMPPQWTLLGVGDLDGDGKADRMWRNSFSGDTWTWKMNGATIGPGGSLGLIP